MGGMTHCRHRAMAREQPVGYCLSRSQPKLTCRTNLMACSLSISRMGGTSSDLQTMHPE